MDKLEFPEVWLSSIDHLDRFNEIAKELKVWKQIFFKQKIDKTFPQLNINGNKIPVIFYSSGTLLLEKNKLTFVAKQPQKILTAEYLNLNNQLEFTIDLGKVKQIDRYKIPNPKYAKSNYPWVKIEMQDGTDYLFLGNLKHGQIEKGLEETEDIYEFLINNTA